MIDVAPGDVRLVFFIGKRRKKMVRYDVMKETYTECILRSLADSDAFQSGRCAAHNGRPETLAIIN